MTLILSYQLFNSFYFFFCFKIYKLKNKNIFSFSVINSIMYR